MLSITRTNNSPQVLLDFDKGILDVRGISSPENSLLFYRSVFEAFDSITRAPSEMTANFEFILFNTSSAKCIFDIMKRLRKMSEKGVLVTINWFYEEEDDDILECGEDFSDLLDLEFQFIAFQEKERVFGRASNGK